MNANLAQCLIISDFTVKSLSGHLENSAASPACMALQAPYDQVAQVILQTDHDSWLLNPQFVVIWTRPERISPTFGRALAGEAVLEQQIVDEVDAFCDLVSRLEGRVSYCFIPTWVLTLPRHGLGVVSLKPEGVFYLLSTMNMRLMRRFASSRIFYLLDTYRWLQDAGKAAYSAKSWYLAKIPFGNEVFALAAKDIKSALRSLGGRTKKLVVADLDGTLWGGVVGDVGWENLVIGGHDALGEAFLDFQQELKSLRNRGILLAIASKNEERVALEAIVKHPEMALKATDFVAWRINWNDKAVTISELVLELNLGLDSVVFLDDNPIERSRVREALPQVFVPELPDDKLLLASFIRGLDCFNSIFTTDTDKTRTQLYQSEREREALRNGAKSLDDWIQSLDTKLLVEPLNERNWDRALQLLNKTNQMNLCTRRLADSELAAWSSEPQNHFWTLRVKDRFGDSGLVGLMSLVAEGHLGRIADFVLSCRVMGRKIEEAMLYQLLKEARELGLESVEAHYAPTPKNAPCLSFFEHVSKSREGNLFTLDPEQFSQPNTFVAVETVPDGASLEPQLGLPGAGG